MDLTSLISSNLTNEEMLVKFQELQKIQADEFIKNMMNSSTIETNQTRQDKTNETNEGKSDSNENIKSKTKTNTSTNTNTNTNTNTDIKSTESKKEKSKTKTEKRKPEEVKSEVIESKPSSNKIAKPNLPSDPNKIIFNDHSYDSIYYSEDYDNMFKLGTSHFRGNLKHDTFISKDLDKAFKLFDKVRASNKEYFGLYYYLGLCYMNGYGVEKDMTEATKWFEKSKDTGHYASAYELARCYHHGLGTNINKEKAKELYQLGADNQHKLSLKALKEHFSK